jgi:PrtD family type I secretion system ABC transporter
MKWLFAPALRPFVLIAGVASLVLNLALLVPSLYMLQVFDRVFSSRSMETLTMLTLIAVASLVLMFLMDTARAGALYWAGKVLDGRLGPLAIHKLLEDAARPQLKKNDHAARDVTLLRSFVTGNGIFAMFDAPWLPIYLLIIYLMHPLMGACAAAGALSYFLLAWLNERLTREPTEKMLLNSRAASRYIDAAVRNAEAVAGMGMEKGVVGRWQELNQQVQADAGQLATTGARMGALVRALRSGMQVLMLAVGAWLVVTQNVSPGIMVAGTILLSKALQPVEMLITGWKSFIEARGAWARLTELRRTRGSRSETLTLPAPRGALDVERLVYGGLPGGLPFIKGISFSLRPGEMLGVIGPSASGKTTLARLLLGIWKPQSGHIRLDGADTSKWPREQLGPFVGYLPQDVELFSGTVAENIARMGEVDSDMVVRAAQEAKAHDMILRLPQGYETQIGEGGAVLSGGQRQRIGLARALHGDPRLVVLDEPNANLDREGEIALVAALTSLKRRGATVVIIGHRPSMMALTDKMAVLQDGQLKAFGPSQEVMAQVTGPTPPATVPAAPRGVAPGGLVRGVR